jgi:hypothetical protein
MLKKSLIIISGILLVISVMSFIVSRAFTQSFQAQNVKTWIAASEAKNKLPNLIVNGLVSESATPTNKIPIENPIIQKAATDALTPSFVQDSLDKIVDGSFRWINSTVPKPDFKINLKPVKQDFAENVSLRVVNRYNSLPACPPWTPPKSTDPFTIDCRPAFGVNIQEESERLKSEILNDTNLLPPDIVTIDTLLSSNNGTIKPFAFNTKIPSTYKNIKTISLLSILLILLFVAIIISASSSIQKGLFYSGMLLSITSLIAGVLTWLSSRGLLSLQNTFLEGQRATTDQEILRSVGSSVYRSFLTDILDKSHVIIGGILLIGLGVILVSKYIVKSRYKKQGTTKLKTPKSN